MPSMMTGIPTRLAFDCIKIASLRQYDSLSPCCALQNSGFASTGLLLHAITTHGSFIEIYGYLIWALPPILVLVLAWIIAYGPLHLSAGRVKTLLPSFPLNKETPASECGVRHAKR